MFCHEKLHVYKKAIQFGADIVKEIDGFPPGNSDIANQLRRAAMSIPLNIAEGAGKKGGADKRRFYSIARGSALECAAIMDLLVAWNIKTDSELKAHRSLLGEVVAMISALALN